MTIFSKVGDTKLKGGRKERGICRTRVRKESILRSSMSCIDLTAEVPAKHHNSVVVIGDSSSDDENDIDDGGFVAIVGDCKDAEFNSRNSHIFDGEAVSRLCRAMKQLMTIVKDAESNVDILRHINRKYAVNLKAGEGGNVVVYGNPINIDIFTTEVIECEEVFFSSISSRRQEKISVFIDHSNILCTDSSSSGRVSIQELILALVDLRDPVKKVVVGSYGSTGSSSSGTSRDYERAGFEVYFQARHNSKEVCVDELLHGQIALELLKTYNTRRTMVLVTGDGNANSGRSTFPSVVEQALKSGWFVEVYSWRAGCSTVWVDFERNYVSDFKLFFLEELERHITYKGNGGTSKKRMLGSADFFSSSGKSNNNRTNNGKKRKKASASARTNELK